jgi:hypothetical protein
MALTMAGKRGLHADDLQARLQRPRRGGDAADQPAAADGDHQRVEEGCARSISRPIVPWPAMTVGVVEGVHEGQALFGGQRQRLLARGVEGLAVQHHLGAEAARALDLHRGRELRHHDHRPQAQALRVVRHALGVVAGRGGDHARSRPAAIRHQRQPACSARRAP